MHTDAKGMSHKLSLGHLDDEECEKILQVLQKDFELREQEKGRIEQIKQVIEEEENKEEVIAKKTKLNENVCVRCYQTFGIIFNRKQLCQTCKLFVCKSCCEYDKEIKGYTCKGCIQERELKLKSFDWFYNNVSKKFKRFGSAKVVRTLYKQKTSRARAYHKYELWKLLLADNESDSGYDPSLYLSLRATANANPTMRRMYQSEGEQDEDFQSIGPAPITPTTISRTSSIETLAHDKTNNNQAEIVKSSINEEEEEKKDKDKQDIYQEAFERYKGTEEKKFRGKFENLLKDLQQSLEQPVLNGGTSFGSTSYGQVIENYRGRLRELLVGVSQRLEMAVESFDSSPNQSPTDTLQKVRKLVSKLVEDSFGEAIDVTSDEAVSDLSSLSDDSCDHQVKSFEEQLSQAVVARVLENFRRDSNIDIPLDFLDGNVSDGHVSDKSHGSHVTPENRSNDFLSKVASSDDENSVVTKTEQVHSRLSDSGINNIDDEESQQNSDHEGSFEEVYRDNLNTGKQVSHKPHKHPRRRKSDRSYTDSSEDDNTDVSSTVKVRNGDSSEVKDVAVETDDIVQDDEQECVEEEEIVSHEQSDVSSSVQRDFEELKQYAKAFASPKHCVQSREVQEVVELVEEPIEKVTVDREESQNDALSKLSFYDRVHDSNVPLPDFSEDYEDNDFFLNEVDPDLLSMNLAPILEEDEDNYIEEEDEEENEYDEDGPRKGATGGRDWRDNWMFGSQLSPYSNLGKQTGPRTMDQVYLTIPTPNDEYSAKVGNRDADQMSDDLSDKDNIDNLSDEESSFFTKSMEEISRITSRKSPSPANTPSLPASTSVQTESEVDTSFDTTASFKSANSRKSEKSYIEDSVPSEGGDPKFEIPPDSITVQEGEPAKFSCRVAGSEPLDVIWYKVEDGEPVQLEDSVDCEQSREQNRHSVTIFNQTQSGQYMCMAVNDKDHCLQYIILNVKKNTQEMKKPEFLKEIQDKEVKEGQNVKFRSKVKGYPQPRVVWYKDGHLLSNGGNYRIEKFGNRDYILTIDYATLEDDAEYWVMAKNVAGEAKSTAQLIVESNLLDSPDNKTKEPTKTAKNKDEQQLQNMSKKLFMTREHVQEETEDMINSANKLSDMHKSLDAFDVMLSSFEKEINTTNPSADDWDSDMLLSHNLQNAVENYNSMKNAAEGLRNTTSSALQILKSTESLLNSEQQELDREYLATSTPRPEESPLPESKLDHTNNNISDRTDVLRADNSDSPSKGDNSEVDHPLPSLDNSSHHKTVDNSSNNSLLNVNNSLVPGLSTPSSSEIEERTFSNVNNIRSDPPHENFSNSTSPDSTYKNADDDSEPTVINFGPKEVDESQYKRDFFVGDKSRSPPRKWEVKTSSYSPRADIVNKEKLQQAEDEIYITASKIFSLETKIHDLHSSIISTNISQKRKLSELEDAVARTVAQVQLSDQDVSCIEKSVTELQSCPTITTTAPPNWDDNTSSLSPSLSIDSGFSSIREKPLQTQLFGETMEDELPESRTELNEDTGVQLPSVNRLKALFNVKKEDASVKRVHSITARSVPKEKLEKLRQQSPSVTKPEQPGAKQQETPTTSKSAITVTLTPGSPAVETAERAPKQIFPEREGEFFPSKAAPSQNKNTVAQQSVTPVSTPAHVSGKARAPQPPALSVSTSSATKSKSPAPQVQKTVTSPSPQNSPASTPQSQSDPKKGKSRIRAGCISARASFWEKRIHGEEAKEEDYPDMIEHVSD